MFFSSVDEFSFVIKLKYAECEEVNKENFEMLFKAVDTALKLSECFGVPEQKSGSVGYSHVFGFGNKVRMSYNPKRVDMGLYVWLSATGLLDLDINRQINFWAIYERLNDLCDSIDYVDTWHYSRLDYVADFLDCGFSVNDLYQSLKMGDTNYYTRTSTINGDIKLRDSKSRLSAIENDGVTNTLYIGSRKSGSNFLLRIYNKKQEQIDSDTPYHIDKAKQCNDWVRYEYSFRKDYAKSIKPLFDDCENERFALSQLARKALDRITFYEIDNQAITAMINQGKTDFCIDDYIDVTKPCMMIDDFAQSNDDLFHLPKKQVNEIYDTFKWHINNDSGIISFLYKVDKIYGYRAIQDFFKMLEITYLEGEVKPSEEAIRYVDDALRRNLDKMPCPWSLKPDDNMRLLKTRHNHINNNDDNTAE